MIIGKLVYNGENNRYSIVNSETEIDLHCGYCFEYQDKYGEWKATRIETGKDGWYLIGADTTINDLEWDCKNYDRKVRIDI